MPCKWLSTKAFLVSALMYVLQVKAMLTSAAIMRVYLEAGADVICMCTSVYRPPAWWCEHPHHSKLPTRLPHLDSWHGSCGNLNNMMSIFAQPNHRSTVLLQLSAEYAVIKAARPRRHDIWVNISPARVTPCPALKVLRMEALHRGCSDCHRIALLKNLILGLGLKRRGSFIYKSAYPPATWDKNSLWNSANSLAGPIPV